MRNKGDALFDVHYVRLAKKEERGKYIKVRTIRILKRTSNRGKKELGIVIM